MRSCRRKKSSKRRLRLAPTGTERRLRLLGLLLEKSGEVMLMEGITGEAERLLKDVRGISFNYFTAKDVVRHPLVAAIIEAYEADG